MHRFVTVGRAALSLRQAGLRACRRHLNEALKGETKTMSIDKSGDENVQNHTEAYYEELASQEEIYLEEREERARTVLISETLSPSECKAESLDEQLNHATEELVTGDSDDPPLSEGTVAEMLRTS